MTKINPRKVLAYCTPPQPWPTDAELMARWILRAIVLLDHGQRKPMTAEEWQLKADALLAEVEDAED